jgi:hypothetical protein
MGAGLRREPPHGVRSLLRSERQEADLKTHATGRAPFGQRKKLDGALLFSNLHALSGDE